jgi:hypothetical protein
MAQVSMTADVAVPPDRLWEIIGHFNALPDWHPAVEKSELEEGGTMRRLSLVGGGTIVERLERSDSSAHAYTYSIIDGPLPVKGYTARLNVHDNGQGGSTVEWSSTFEPAGASENEAVKVIQGIYQAGFDNLRRMFGA